MENLEQLKNFWANKKVLVTGHSGFKGSWLILLLDMLGAKIAGCSLKPNSKINFYDIIKNDININSKFIDINNYKKLNSFVEDFKPSIIFHLAAQPIVNTSYDDPLSTYSTNVMGLVHLFESLKNNKNTKTIINITSDKCYYNNESKSYFKEDDKLCGTDPYSNSKSCAELITYSYFHSFFKHKNIGLASARAGNVIGGGDWSKDRLVTDIMNSYFNNMKLQIRNPNSTRPWQHVIEVLYGYLILAEKMHKNHIKYSEGWNFAPSKANQISVNQLIGLFNNHKKTKKINIYKSTKSESNYLFLDNTKTRKELKWKNQWNIKKVISNTYSWYDAYYNNKNMTEYSQKLIRDYIS